MNSKTILLICSVWLIITSLYLASISLDAGTISVVDFGLLKASILDMVTWSLFSILLYHLLKKPIIQQKFVIVSLIFIVVYVIWQPFLLIFNAVNTTYFKGQKLPEIAQIFTHIRFIYVFSNFIQYIFVFSFCTGLIYYRYTYQIKLKTLALEKKNTENELKFSEMKMQALQAQLSPHFLFNSLNSISALVRTSQHNNALDAIASLGDLLRYSLTASKCSLISLEEEITFTNHYVELQRLRFNERFNFKLHHNVSPESVQCPPFILQTLIENAFTHSVFDQTTIMQIVVEITTSKHQLKIASYNTIHNKISPQNNGMGLALQNLKDRLYLLYEHNFSITFNNDIDKYCVNLTIPIKPDHDDFKGLS